MTLSQADPRPTEPVTPWWVRPAILVAIMITGAVLVLTLGLPPVGEIRAWVDGFGWAAPVLFAVLFAVITLIPAPASVLCIAAGVLFGLPIGLAAVLAGALGGAVGGFTMARALGRTAVERFAGPRVVRFNALLRRRGLLAVLGLRLVPVIPFTVLNLACGLTGMRLRDFAVGTEVGIVPAVTAYVAVGAYGAEPGSVPFLLALGGLVVLTAAAFVVNRRRARLRP